MSFTDAERQAAFNSRLFLNGFLKDFRKKRDEPNFVKEQQVRLKKYDGKNVSTAATTTAANIPPPTFQPVTAVRPAADLIAAPQPSLPASAVKSNIAAVKQVVTTAKQVPAARPTPAAKPVFTAAQPVNAPSRVTAANKETAARTKRPLSPVIKSKPVIRTTNTTPPAIPGPGPSSSEHAATIPVRHPRVTSEDLEHLQRIEEEDIRRFQDIENEDSFDSDSDRFVPRQASTRDRVDVKGKMKDTGNAGKGRKTPSGNRHQFSSMNVMPRERLQSAIDVIRSRGKVVKLDERGEEEIEIYDVDDSDDDDEDVPSRPAKSSRQGKKHTIRRSPSGKYYPIPSGEYHVPKCSRCQISSKACEKQQSGGACVNCRTFKHKCEYSKLRKEVKSKPTVESEDSSSSPPSSPPPPPTRHPRIASAVAVKAIKKAVTASEKGAKIQLKRSDTHCKCFYIIVNEEFY